MLHKTQSLDVAQGRQSLRLSLVYRLMADVGRTGRRSVAVSGELDDLSGTQDRMSMGSWAIWSCRLNTALPGREV